jgi:restriction endonuclease S subunit
MIQLNQNIFIISYFIKKQDLVNPRCVANINDHSKKLEIPLPPLETQRAIVSPKK